MTDNTQTATAANAATARKNAFAIIQGDAKERTKAVDKYLRSYSSSRDELHVLYITCLYHAAEHGDVRPLQRLYDGMKPNDQTAMRYFIGLLNRKHKMNNLPSVNFLNMRDGAWRMRSKVEEEKAEFRKLAEEKLINPDGVNYKRFDDFDNVESNRTINFGDDAFIRALDSILAKAKGERENVKSTVTPEFIAQTEKLREFAKTRAKVNVPEGATQH